MECGIEIPKTAKWKKNDPKDFFAFEQALIIQEKMYYGNVEC